MEIITAVLTSLIAGLFSLAGIWLHHNLNMQSKAQAKALEVRLAQPESAISTDTVEPPITNQTTNKFEPESAPEHDSTPSTKIATRHVPLLLWLSILPYTGFTLLLLSSSGDDKTAGYFFLINSVLIMVGSVFAFLGKVSASKICIAAVFVQLLVMVGMLVMALGDLEIIVPLNLAIAFGFGLMALFYRIKRES
jgi:hypothetical protein